MNFLIQGGRVLDPKNRKDGTFDVQVSGGRIARVGRNLSSNGSRVVPARGLWVLPGLVDAHVHLREPGGEASETIATGTRSAAAGGVTSLLAMANTQPATDTPEKIRAALRRARETGIVKVYPVGAVTKGLEGKELADVAGMAREGARAISDDGRCVMDSKLLRRALEEAKKRRVVLIEHSEDENLSAGGAMNEGPVCASLGACGIPSESEAIMVARNVFLARLTGAALHLAHVSNRDSIDLVRWAKARKIPVTAETCPHYFALSDAAVRKHGTHAKMKPPLRSPADVRAVKEGLRDGTIDLIATDHAPHARELKLKPLGKAPFGIIGMPTLFPLIYNELIVPRALSPLEAVRKVTCVPAALFGLKAGTLSPGAPADIALFDPSIRWKPRPEDFRSKSANSPFIGRTFKGRIVATFVDGRQVFRLD